MLSKGFVCVFLGLAAATTACGGSVTGLGAGGGADAGRDAATFPDAGGGADVAAMGSDAASSDAAPADAVSPHAYDGTTGKACATDADCQSPGGPGLARCSSTALAPDEYYPTPVCILPTCATVSDDTAVHYCDGPDDPSSPGMCVPWGTTGTAKCLPKCSYDTSGSPPAGCQGKDTCIAATSISGSVASGYGYCWGGCTGDADCPTGQRCQVDEGTCHVGLVPPTKNIGDPCTEADENSEACMCLYASSSGMGYCTSFCVVGEGSTCPAGYVCGSDEYRSTGYSAQNTGMAGRCHALCDPTDAGSTCPGGSSCSDLFASGPYCIVP